MGAAEKWEAVKMKRGWSYAISIALLLVIISVLAMACTGLSSTTNPPSSTLSLPSSSYPADIIGHVTIAKNVFANNQRWWPGNKIGDNAQFWIIQVSVRNKSYQSPITSESAMWAVTTNPQYSPLSAPFASPLVTIPKGQSGEITFCFEVFGGLNPNDYQLCYVGQTPQSYGKLVNSDIVADVYDCDSQKMIQKYVPESDIATVDTIEVGGGPLSGLLVQLKPINAKAGTTYIVELYEKGTLRTTQTTSWNQPQLNVRQDQMVFFGLTQDEWNAYWPAAFSDSNWWKPIFSVKVYK